MARPREREEMLGFAGRAPGFMIGGEVDGKADVARRCLTVVSKGAGSLNAVAARPTYVTERLETIDRQRKRRWC